MAKGLAILALLVLCELSSVAAASQHLADKEATMAGAAQARDADETDTDGEEGTDDSEGLEDANGRANGRAEQGGGDPDDSEEDVGDDNDDMMDGLPPLEEEHAYYSSLDNNKDGVLDQAEFRAHLQRVSALNLKDGEAESDNFTIGMTVGKLWVELAGSDAHESAFAEIDANADKKVTWDEWIHEMFHDEPQEPVFVDGEDGDIFTEELMLTFDKDGDKSLNFEEARAFVGKHMRREDVDGEYAGKHEERSTKGGVGMTYLFMIEFDSNHDNKVSMEEWNDGFQGQAEEAMEQPGIGDGIVER